MDADLTFPKQILAAIDFSDVTEDVLRTAAALAERCGCGLRVLHVAAPDPAFIGYELGPQSIRDVRARELREEHAQLEAVRSSFTQRGIPTRVFLIAGVTDETILRQAEDCEADLIVIGSHGHGMIRRALVGSASEGVLRHAPCPVIVVPSPREKTPEDRPVL